MGKTLYGAWHRPFAKGADIPQHLGEFKLPDEAKQCASQHNDLQRMKA